MRRNITFIITVGLVVVFLFLIIMPIAHAQGIMAKAEKNGFRVIVDTHGLGNQYVYSASLEVICYDQSMRPFKGIVYLDDIIRAGARHHAFINKPMNCIHFTKFGRSWITERIGKGDSPAGGGWSGNVKTIKSQVAQNGKRIKYTITNSSNYQVRLVFLPTGNTTTIAPGQKKPCNSPIKNGKYPKVKAKASNGATWLRTISKQGCDYYIVNRDAAGIQIVP